VRSRAGGDQGAQAVAAFVEAAISEVKQKRRSDDPGLMGAA
jgi:hypothetical protein